MFLSPAKNNAQCADIHSKLHSIWEQNDFKTNLLQLSSFKNLSIIRLPQMLCTEDLCYSVCN